MITKLQIATIKSLKDRSSRSQLSMFVAEGEKMFEEIVDSTFLIQQLFFVQEDVEEATLKKIKTLSAKKSCEIFDVSKKEMERITHLKTATPILLCVAIPTHHFDLKNLKNSLVLALDNVQDPGNIGTIVRIADWFGIKDILCSPSTVDVYNPKVIQATMGAITRVRVHYLPLKEILQQAEMDLYGTFLDGEDLYKMELSAKTGIVIMGNEGNGISDEIGALVSKRLLIPSYPKGAPTSESLNVSVATAIVCNEFRRG